MVFLKKYARPRAQEVAVFACGCGTGNHPSPLGANAKENSGTSLLMIQTCLGFGATMRAANSAGAIAIASLRGQCPRLLLRT